MRARQADNKLDGILSRLENAVAYDMQKRMRGDLSGASPKSIHAHAKIDTINLFLELVGPNEPVPPTGGPFSFARPAALARNKQRAELREKINDLL